MKRSQPAGAGAPARPVPRRTCIACRIVEGKRALLRLVRDAEGRVSLDRTGKRSGRGAYLCAARECWEVALRRGMLERALRIDRLNEDDRAALIASAAAMPSRTSEND
ncbi:MAG: YlxR family protein [Chloroflexi bacterium]|nr:YlxR family protein [Chloroflexota bacterium]